jgi:hypothetical protein
MRDEFNLGYFDGETWADRAERLGLALGFPKCCVAEWINEIDLPSHQRRKLDGTGYIPCRKCNEKTEDELVSVINTNRLCYTPFPIDPWSS